MSIPMTVVGNLVENPELRFTPSGQLDRETNDWKDGATTYVTVNVWRGLAENVAESLKKGDQVVVVGKFKQREFETREGEQRMVYEVDADSVGVSLAYVTAPLTKNTRRGD